MKSMILVNKAVLRYGILLVLVFAMLLNSISVSAASGSISISTPDSVQENTNFTTIISTSIDAEVNIVTAYVTFDPAKIQFISLDTSGNSYLYDMPAPDGPEIGSGFVKIARFSTAKVTSGQTIARITFKALKVGSASIAVSKDNSSLLDNLGDDILTSTGTSVLSVSAIPPAAPTSDPTSNSPKTTNGSTPIARVSPDTSLTPDSGIDEDQEASLASQQDYDAGSSKDSGITLKKVATYLLPVAVVLGLLGAGSWFYTKKYLPNKKLAGKVNKIPPQTHSELTGTKSPDIKSTKNLNTLEKIHTEVPEPESIIKPNTPK